MADQLMLSDVPPGLPEDVEKDYLETVHDYAAQFMNKAVEFYEKAIELGDAHHISNPSKTAEGCYRALRAVTADVPKEEIAFINVHGTSTLYNDEMEAVAVARAGLQDVPLNSLKGYYGHTMGAAGVLETVLSMQALDDRMVLATRGFEELGVSRPVHLSEQNETATGRYFVKLLSGFGGCNAAMLFRKGGAL